MDVAFVAGSTGYSGKGVVAACRSAGVETYAHVRPDSSQLGIWRARFEAQGAKVDTTAWDVQALTARLRELKPTVVYGLLGTTRARGKRSGGKDTYETVDFGLTKMLVEAAQACGHAPRFVYLSSGGAGKLGRGAYLDARTRVEQLLEQSGLPFTIVRAGPIGGPDREEERAVEHAFVLLKKILHGLDAMGFPDLERKYGPVSSEQMGRALTHLRRDDSPRRIVVPQEIKGTALQG